MQVIERCLELVVAHFSGRLPILEVGRQIASERPAIVGKLPVVGFEMLTKVLLTRNLAV